MKWNKEQEQQLKTLCFEEKSNKEIAQTMNIDLVDVHNGRSRFGVTIDKVKVAKTAAENVQLVAEQKVKRFKEDIVAEIVKVEKALEEAGKKTNRCRDRLEVLYKELVEAHDNNNNIRG